MSLCMMRSEFVYLRQGLGRTYARSRGKRIVLQELKKGILLLHPL
ncbi:unnamed protein product [Linum tenue]|uniref:Ribosomal protein L16 n=1 Tax=Linum tenue TaxID=586396 RepID=A0AAV0IXR5_9ROSI|nr:unnamed protein product [Linum tenue]